MDVFRSLWFIAATFTGLTSGAGILPDNVLNAAVGGTVTFITSVSPPGTPFVAVTWDFVNTSNVKINIITSTGSNITAPQYVDRITLFRSIGSLELRNLTLNDSGQYLVSIIPDGQQQITGQTTLNVLVPVSSVTVNVSGTDLVEFNSSVSLSCSSSGSSLSFLWLNGSSVVTATDRVQLLNVNRTITIVNVSRYDQGPFRCRVSNAVSNETSDPVKLSISFGPDDVNLKKSPSQEDYLTGSNVDLSCSAVSSPAAQFTWFLNRTQLPDTGPELRLTNIQMNQSGDYSCQAFNTKTLRYQTSQPSAVIVLVTVSNVTVTVSGTDLVEFNSSVSLSCSSSGSSLSFLWLNGSSEVTATDRVQLLNVNRTITIVNVSRYDQGPFRCRVSNAVSSETSDPVKLSISFGPDDVNLKKSPSQEDYLTGSNVDLSCSAVSSPAAQFTWFLNRTKLPDTGPELRLTNIQMNQSGDYSCQAFNTKTLRYQTSQPSAVIVLEHDPSTGGCSGGCIAGIVIAVVVVVVVLVVLLVYFLWIKPKKKKLPPNRDVSTRTGGEGQDNATQNQELHYAHVSFQKTDGGTVQMKPEDNQTPYAEINAYKPQGPSSPPTYDAHMHRMRGRAPQPGANGAHGAQVHRN